MTTCAVRKLDKFVKGQKSEIVSESAARVFLAALRAGVHELREYEKHMDADVMMS